MRPPSTRSTNARDQGAERSFSAYFSQRGAVRVLALAWSMGVGLVAASTFLHIGDAEELIVERMDAVPLAASRRSPAST